MVTIEQKLYRCGWQIIDENLFLVDGNFFFVINENSDNFFVLNVFQECVHF